MREAEPPIVPRERLGLFIDSVFHNFGELHAHHRRLLDRLYDIQREEHPVINSVTAAIFDAALNWREAYMEYVTNYPIAEYRIVDEMNNNPTFKSFVEVRIILFGLSFSLFILNDTFSNVRVIQTQIGST